MQSWNSGQSAGNSNLYWHLKTWVSLTALSPRCRGDDRCSLETQKSLTWVLSCNPPQTATLARGTQSSVLQPKLLMLECESISKSKQEPPGKAGSRGTCYSHQETRNWAGQTHERKTWKEEETVTSWKSLRNLPANASCRFCSWTGQTNRTKLFLRKLGRLLNKVGIWWYQDIVNLGKGKGLSLRFLKVLNF